MHRFVPRFALVLCASMLAAVGCAEREAPSQGSTAAAATAPAAAPTAAAVGTSGGAEPPSPSRPIPAERKLIQTAELGLEVTSYADARRALDRQLAETKGYVANAQVEHHDGCVSRATLVLRIPAEALESFLGRSAAMGTVLRESLETEDITDQYVDLTARLRSARKLEARLLELLGARTEGVKDLLEVERELARVRQQIESMDGKLRLYDEQVGYSTLRLELVTKQTYAGGPPPSLLGRAASALSASWSALVSLGKGLVIALAGLLPWLPLLLGGAWLARRGWQRLARKLQAGPRVTAAAAAASWPAGPPPPPPPAAPIAPPAP